ncbi:sce7725 family protein [Levilactobacillus bambusae]|uniref:Sce7725 family protein n=1 Tax=Levilactobacillus bambusae TaxID=2024736 RepID=A0A2V1MYQ4_9LACO|nr:sce7725 family protein [Levilactobacillus bambusae]PWG00097.1 hypothetical protein DCM90_03950 [Levilactobacillus bambusae]
MPVLNYYPYFRGRQYDLIALREAVESGDLSPHLIPILEPVKDSSGLLKTVRAFIKRDHPIAIIVNPQVSRYLFTTKKRFPLTPLMDQSQVIPTAILTPQFVPDLLRHSPRQSTMMLVDSARALRVAQEHNYLALADQIIIPPEARIRRSIQQPKIRLVDHFPLRDHTSDYAELADEFFSDDLTFAEMMGYTGFSDYSIMGHHYFERGHASRAIALHIVYAHPDGGTRIHHFVSDSNATFTNPKQKFFEALAKLSQWDAKQATINQTKPLQTLLAYQDSHKFPGLGTVKKLMIEHQLIIFSRLLDQSKSH